MKGGLDLGMEKDARRWREATCARWGGRNFKSLISISASCSALCVLIDANKFEVQGS